MSQRNKNMAHKPERLFNRGQRPFRHNFECLILNVELRNGLPISFAIVTSGRYGTAEEKKKEGANFKTPTFAQSLRHAQSLILEIFFIFLRLKFSPSPAHSPGSST